MLINCPQCHFQREIDMSQIPQDAIMATCPKCQTRFQFRTIDDHFIESSKNIGQKIPPETSENQISSLTTSNKLDDSLPPGAFVPKADTSGMYQRSPENKNLYQSKEAKKSSSVYKDQPTSDTNLIPWEHPEQFDFFSSFYQTVIRVMFNPSIFFSTIPNATSSLLRPLFFYILLRLFQTLMDSMWFMISFQALEPSITESSLHELLNTVVHEMTVPMTLIMTPVTLALQIGIYSLLFYFMLRLIQPEQTRFSSVFRVIAYSAAPTITCIIPIIGSLVGSLWFAVSCFIGCKYALNLSWRQTALALIPLYLISLTIGMQGVKQFLPITG